MRSIPRRRPYQPPIWAPNGFTQTVFPALFRRGPRLRYMQQALELPDGDVTRVNWLRRAGAGKLAVLLPGLEGRAEVPYMRHMAGLLFSQGWDVAVLDHRGCGMPNRLFESYHSGRTGDLDFFLSRQTHYRRRLGLGFSLGGNIMLKYVGSHGAAAHLDAAVAVAPPFELSLSSRALETRFGGLLGRYFLHHLRRRVAEKALRFPERLPADALRACRSVKAFDDLYTAPAHGFHSADDYYLRNSSWHFLTGIEKPTLILHAENDPINPLPRYVRELLGLAQPLTAVISAHGGHMGFPRSRSWRPRWHELQILQWLGQPQKVWHRPHASPEYV